MADLREGRAAATLLDPARTHWVPSGVAPCRDWSGMPGCRKGSRFLVGAADCKPGSGNFPTFDSRADCLRWIMAHRIEIVAHAPGAMIVPADLAQWMLGLA